MRNALIRLREKGKLQLFAIDEACLRLNRLLTLLIFLLLSLFECPDVVHCLAFEPERSPLIIIIIIIIIIRIIIIIIVVVVVVVIVAFVMYIFLYDL